MFSVTGVDGQIFHGMLEDLLRTNGVLSSRIERSREPAGTLNLPDTERRQDHVRYQAAARAYAGILGKTSSRTRIHHAYQVMTRGVSTVRVDTMVEEAWRMLCAQEIGQAPVLDHQHQLVGLVSRENLLRVLNEDGGRLRDVLPRTVRDVMVTPIVAAEPVTDVRRVARVMLEYSLSAVPVIDESGWLVGIVSHRDILKVAAAEPPLELWA